MTTSEAAGSWSTVRDELRSRGLRWTPQRRLILDVLAATSGHVTGSEIVDRCRERDAETTPSTVYRTLDVLEELGYLSHSHGADGREEFHVLPETRHAHLQCAECGGSWSSRRGSGPASRRPPAIDRVHRRHRPPDDRREVLGLRDDGAAG